MGAMSARSDRVVIVGAGLAGVCVARGLRKRGHTGPVLLLGGESHAPYDRPPLSKQYLLDGNEDTLKLLHEPLPGVEVLSGCAVTAIDLARHTVLRQDGSSLVWDRLVFATGTRPRQLASLSASQRVMSLRSLEDARRLRQHLQPGVRLLMIGGGPIGLELAATAQQMGAQVTVVEASTRLMGRSAPPLIADHLLEYHRSRGVDIRLGSSVVSVSDEGRVVFTDGNTLEVDWVVVGIGVSANDSLAAAAGITTDDGILVDSHGRTSADDVYAAGDVTRQRNPLSGRIERIETWSNAQDQAEAVAAAMVEQESAKPYDGIPWYWSDQGGLRLQCAGLTHGDTQALRGDPARGSFVLLQWLEGRLCGVAAVNAAREFNLLRRLLGAGCTLTPEQLTAPGLNLKEIASLPQPA